jgi:activator of HSP90 ATPase
MSETIKQEVTLNATPENVFSALTQSETFAEMTGQPATIDAAEGGAFSRFGDQVVGRIIEIRPGRRLVEAWRVSPWPEGKYSIVSFDIEASDRGTRLSLEHDGYPPDHRDHLEAGWKKMYLDPLKAHFG